MSVYTESTKALTSLSTTGLQVGSSVTIDGTTTDANGRYVVYSLSPVVIGTRAVNRDEFCPTLSTDTIDVVMREDDLLRTLFMQVTNRTMSSQAVTLVFTTSAASTLISSWGTVTGLQVAGTLTAGQTATMSLAITGATSGVTFTLTPTAPVPVVARLGEAVVVNSRTERGVNHEWKWGGLIRRGLYEGYDQPDITVYKDGVAGWFLGFGYPGIIENDSYTITSPEDVVVFETQHNNTNNYTETDIKKIVRDRLVPTNVPVVIGFV